MTNPLTAMINVVSRWSMLHRMLALFGLLVVVTGISTYRFLVPAPKVIFPTGPALGVTKISNVKPITIIFDRPVKQSTLRYAIHPTLPGRWALETNFWSSRSTLIFTPTESPDLDTRYTVELAGIQSWLGGKPQKYLLSFQTDTKPIFSALSPAPAATDVMPDAPIVVTFDKPLSDAVDVTVTLSPETTLGPPTISGSTATFAHADLFQKGTTYTATAWLATVKRHYTTKTTTINEEKVELGSTSFTTIAAPSIQAHSPTGSGVNPANPIRLEFQQSMDRPSVEAALTIAPPATGTFSWENDQTVIYTPGPALAKATAYTVTLANTAKAASGFTLDESFSWSFTTLGRVAVSDWSPNNNATNVDINTNISVTFNQAVDQASAAGAFSLNPSVAGEVAWDGTTMTFNPSAALAYSQAYTITIAAGVKTVNGLDSDTAFTAKFTTRNQSVMLSVPAYRQDHVYSCMISAARSALAFRGVVASESSIISKVGRDTTAWSGTWGGSNGVWGDPDAAIVGPLDNAAATSPAGKTTTNVYWGYGSHWGPIARVLTTYGVSNEVRSGMTVQDLAQSLADGNPVIVWWVNGIWPSYAVNWKTPSGKSIRGVNGLHVQVVRGFTGTVDNPVSFTVTDSGYGFPGRAIDIGTFKAKWAWFNNTGIIVQ